MKKYKKLYLMLIVLVTASLFTGCNQEEQEFVEAMVKSQEMLTLESTSDVSFDLSVEGLDDETQLIFDEVANQVNNMELSISQKAVSNEEQTVAKAQVDANILLSGMSFDSSIWVDMDMSGDKMVLKEIFQLPSMLMNMMPNGAGKEYLVLDFDTMNESLMEMDEDMPESMDFDQTMAIAMKYQKQFTDAFVSYMTNYHSDLPIISKLDDQIVDGETIKYYQVEFDNDSFKAFMEQTVISLLKDENIIPLFEEYMTELMDLSGEEMPAELSLPSDMGEMVTKTKEFFDKMDDLTILGQDGMLITFGINEDGYFISEKGKMDFVIDTKEWMALAGESVEANEMLEEMSTPVFALAISYDSNITNINQDLEITMPTITAENSLDYMELLENMVAESMESLENMEDQGLVLIIEDELIEFTNEPILVDNHYLFSTRDMAKALDMVITWDQDSKSVMMEKGDTQLEPAITIREGVSYIPLRPVAENFGYELEWHQEYQMIIIDK